jgi:hypothetical protein
VVDELRDQAAAPRLVSVVVMVRVYDKNGFAWRDLAERQLTGSLSEAAE